MVALNKICPLIPLFHHKSWHNQTVKMLNLTHKFTKNFQQPVSSFDSSRGYIYIIQIVLEHVYAVAYAGIINGRGFKTETRYNDVILIHL